MTLGQTALNVMPSSGSHLPYDRTNPTTALQWSACSAFQISYLLLSSCVDGKGWTAVEATHACHAGYLAPETILVFFLPSHLLDGQCHRVHQPCNVDVHHAQVGALEATRNRGVVVDPSPLVDACYAVYIVDATELGESLSECFNLLIPISDIKLC